MHNHDISRRRRRCSPRTPGSTACCTSPRRSRPASPSSGRSCTGSTTWAGRSRCSTRCATPACPGWSSARPPRSTATRTRADHRGRAATPTSPYGWTKLAVDMAIAHAAAAHGLGAVSLRYFNVAGALIRHGGAAGRAARPGDPPDPDRAGGRRRPAREAADLRRRLPDPRRHLRPRLHPRRGPGRRRTCWRSTRSSPARHRIYNLGNGNGFSNRRSSRSSGRSPAHPMPVETAPRRPGDPATLVASSAPGA